MTPTPVCNPAMAFEIACEWQDSCDASPFWEERVLAGRRHDVLDTVMKLERPFNYTQQEGAKFEVHFEKTRSFAGDAAEPVGLSHVYEGGISHWEQFVVGNEKAQEVTDLLLEGLTQRKSQFGLAFHRVKSQNGRP